jgi:signal transduction histidine kinase
VIYALYLHPSSPPAGRVATALADADPDVAVHTATTVDGAQETLRTAPVDCVVDAFDPADERGSELVRAVVDVAPDLPHVPAATTDGPAAVDALVDRIVAAAGTADTSASAILDAVPGVAALVAPDGGIRRWNAAVTDAVDDDATVPGSDVTALVAPAARSRLSEALAMAAETGRHVVEAPVETPAGERIDHEWTITRIDDDAFAVVGLDVSERAAVAAELRATEASLAALYETLSDRDLTFEARLGRVLDVGCERLGVDYGFLTRITADTQRVVASTGTHPSLQPDEECPLSEAYCRKTIRNDGLLGVHDAIADGWEADPAYDAFGLGCYLGGKVLVDGDLYGTLCFAADEARGQTFTDVERAFVELLTRWVSYELEERAAREKLERQNDRLSEFASIVSHDLRNPLNVAKGNVDIARETSDSTHLDEAREALDRMDALVTDLLELAKQGSVMEDVDEVTLAAVAEDAWANVATEGAELVVEADGEVEADRDRLLQLLENLFRNSVEHGSTESRTESGDSVEHSSTDNRRGSAGDSVEHGSTAPRSDARGDSVEHGTRDQPDATPLTVTAGVLPEGFYVADTGPGIPPDERDAVFERGHSTNDGTGLGLPIVQAIAEAHGWTVELGESDDGGVRFEFVGVDRPVRA